MLVEQRRARGGILAEQLQHPVCLREVQRPGRARRRGLPYRGPGTTDKRRDRKHRSEADRERCAGRHADTTPDDRNSAPTTAAYPAASDDAVRRGTRAALTTRGCPG